ncbi:MAG TPA: hypothetical protein VMF88_10635 [Bacteroidota bacterium]|nr:hypothetical protein [Bacteroidota bacterium]
MQKDQLNILAINPGSRYLGIAIFVGDELRDWAVKLARRENIREMISEYINQYGVHVVAFKKFHPSRSSRDLRMIISLMQEVAKKAGLALREYSIGEVEEALLPEKRKNKQLLMQEVVARYPFLSNELQREAKNKNPYLIRMFETVGIGKVCMSELETGVRKVEKKQL